MSNGQAHNGQLIGAPPLDVGSGRAGFPKSLDCQVSLRAAFFDWMVALASCRSDDAPLDGPWQSAVSLAKGDKELTAPSPGPLVRLAAIKADISNSPKGANVIGLKFTGIIVNGIGKHSELVVPGRNLLANAPADWPEELFPGSLNLLVKEYPAEFAARRLPPSTKTLDKAGFVPEFTIRQDLMQNNQLTTTETMAHRGTAQVWRAHLATTGREVSCWVLRRFGSGLANQLELVSAIGLRGELGLSREQQWPAVVTLFGHWRGGD